MIRKCSKSEKNRNRMYYCCPKSKVHNSKPLKLLKSFIKFMCWKCNVNLICQKTETRGWDWGCKYFLWENELKPCPCGKGKCAVNECREKGRKVLWCSLQVCQMFSVVLFPNRRVYSVLIGLCIDLQCVYCSCGLVKNEDNFNVFYALRLYFMYHLGLGISIACI